MINQIEEELTVARLAVNDWHACSTQEELERWRFAQQRLIRAARAAEAQNYLSRYWLDNYLSDSGLCSLCGNTGRIDTTLTAASHAGVRSGRVNFCICPNGVACRAKEEQTA